MRQTTNNTKALSPARTVLGLFIALCEALETTRSARNLYQPHSTQIPRPYHSIGVPVLLELF